MNRNLRQTAIERLQPAIERAGAFSGWDLASAGMRSLGPPVPWDYEAIVAGALRPGDAVLDLGTGGGEVFEGILLAAPPAARAVATEEWVVNAPIAAARLRLAGAAVVRASAERGMLPFADGTFDLVVSRHEALVPADVARLLRPGGRFISQQVEKCWPELRRYFPRQQDFGNIASRYAAEFRRAGTTIERQHEHDARVAFADLASVVFVLSIAPWTVPGFALEGDIDALLALESDLATSHGIIMGEGRSLLVVRKPAAG